MNSDSKYQIDMCHGPLFSKLILFSVPLMFSYILQMMFNTADLIVIGRFASSEALAAVGATSGLTTLVLNIFFGLSVSVNVLTARGIGAKDRKNVADTMHTAAAVALYGGLAIAVIGILISKPMLRLMSTPENILDKSTLYMRIYCAASPFIICYNFGSAILRARGDTRRPLYYMVIAGIINVLLNLFFVLVFKMDAGGVALATLIANAVSAFLIVLSLTGAGSSNRLIWKKVRIHGAIFKEMLKIGLPAGIQGAFFSISNITIQSSINSFGAMAIAGNTAAQSLEGFVEVGSIAYYHTPISFVGQNHGARKYKRILRSIFLCILCACVLSLVFGVGCYLLGTPLLKIYNSNPEVIQWGLLRMKILFPTYFLCALMDVISGSLRGLGHSVKPTVITLLGVCGFRIFWVFFIFPLNPVMESLMISYPASWALVSLVNGGILFAVCRKMFRDAAHVHSHFGSLTIR